MSISLSERFTVEKNLIYILIAVVLIVFGFIFYLFFARGSKGLLIMTPNGGEEWEIGQIHEITWKAKGIDKVGIVLFKDREPEWIVKGVPAESGKYKWKIYPGQEYKDGYWIAVFEYPWRKDNEIDYADASFAIVYPEFDSCDSLSTQKEWLYLPSDSPNLRKVFITKNMYTGNLGGLEGADEICQGEAEEQGFGGIWRAFIGGDSDEDAAIKRMEDTPRKTEGIFVSAEPTATLIRAATCHRLLGRNFDEFFEKFSNLLIINDEKLEERFVKNMDNLWLGRLDEQSRKNCLVITSALSELQKPLAEKYSLTTTCQNWTKGDKLVDGYPDPSGGANFPTCYTPEGISSEVVALAGLSSGLTGGGIDVNAFIIDEGKYCNLRQKLICIEE